jgi:hypothetical protein
VGITVAGLVAGVLVGAALQSWLRVDIVPLGVRAPTTLILITARHDHQPCTDCSGNPQRVLQPGWCMVVGMLDAS